MIAKALGLEVPPTLLALTNGVMELTNEAAPQGARTPSTLRHGRRGLVVPAAIAGAATIRNKNTRMAYYRAVTDFFAWCDHHKIGSLVDAGDTAVRPFLEFVVATYIEALQERMAKPTVKQHLAAIRMLFDWKEAAVLRGHTDTVWSADFSPDGKRVVTASADTSARLWDVNSGKEAALLKGHTDHVVSAAFSRRSGMLGARFSDEESISVRDNDLSMSGGSPERLPSNPVPLLLEPRY
jgi:WD40 repeat protein